MLIYNEEELKNDMAVNFGRPYQQCSIGVMDTIGDPDITFDVNGVSNYYYEYLEKEKEHVIKGDAGKAKLKEIAEKIKERGRENKYDCITGVSGGVDSTYLTYIAKNLGLRPLIVHFDNGWNSEMAVKNIEHIISKLGFDLYTFVVSWEEFRDLQISYLKASVVDIEVLTDHAIVGTLYKLAAQHNIRYILSGYNIVTEGTLPASWVFNKTDHVNIKSIHKQFGNHKLKTYPLFDATQKRIYAGIKEIETINLLNYLPYNKTEVKETIKRELEWKDYGGKHYESIFTRFYQGYILPVKFNIDKRKAHLSNLIYSGQLTKDEALKELKLPIYNKDVFKNDYEFVLKKLGLSDSFFQSLMAEPRREHSEFEIEKGFFEKYPLLKPIKPLTNFAKKFIVSDGAQK